MATQKRVLRSPALQSDVREQTLTGPAIEAVNTTFTALDRSVDTITSECRAIGKTLVSLNDALSVISRSGDGQAWSGFGLIGLPILGALRAIRGVAAQYLEQETNASLSDWVDFVASSARRFEAYVDLLNAVTSIAREHRGDERSAVSAEELELLADVRWQTQAWKQVLAGVRQLGRVVDAVLQVDPDGAEVQRIGDKESAGLSHVLQGRFKNTESGVLHKSAEMREWVLRPFVEVREAVKALPRQVDHVAHEVALLELLLDLAISQIRAQQGEITEVEARVVGMRVAATVVLPELAQEISDVRRRAETLAANMDRLAAARARGQVGMGPYTVLAEEYQQELTVCRSRMAELEAGADVWRREGPSIVDGCVERAQLELDVLAARSLVEQGGPAGDRRPLLERELEHLTEIRTWLTSL